MNLENLPKTTTKKLRRVGRGHGSGRVKTSGRGTKGQNAREKVGLKFAGSSLQASWLKRLPLLRGKGKNKSLRITVMSLNVGLLNNLKAKSEVTLKSLQEAGLVGARVEKVKILSTGELKVALNVKLPCSAGAKKKIEEVGGSVVITA